jgi:hypothetical protein
LSCVIKGFLIYITIRKAWETMDGEVIVKTSMKDKVSIKKVNYEEKFEK